MSKMKFKLNYDGVGELLKGSEMKDLLSNKADEIQGRCGAGYKSDVRVGKTRVNAMVSAATFQAKRDNLKNNTILKAVR